MRGKVLTDDFFPWGKQRTKFLEASFREEVWASAGAGVVAGFRVLGVGVQFSSVALASKYCFNRFTSVNSLNPLDTLKM